MQTTFYLHKMTPEETAKQMLTDFSIWAQRRKALAIFAQFADKTVREGAKHAGEASAYQAILDLIASIEVRI